MKPDTRDDRRRTIAGLASAYHYSGNHPEHSSKVFARSKMGVFACTAGRFTLRRAAQRKQQSVSSLTRRPKSSAVEKPSSEPAGDATSGRTIPTPDTILQQPLWQRLGLLSNVFNAYGRAQKRRTYATQLCTSVVIYFCGDLSAQTIGHEGYNPWRTVRNVLIGGLSSIPSYNWYKLCGPLL